MSDDYDDEFKASRFGPGAPLDPQFDFESYFAKTGTGTATKEELEEFAMRVMGQFMRDFCENGATGVPHWIMNYLCEQFNMVLLGEEWERAFPLPWTTPTPIYSRSQQQALEIFCDVANALKGDPSLSVTTAIAAAARSKNVSYETARAAWYKQVKNMPRNFLKRDKTI